MEASQQGDPGQAQDSQQEPTQDSGLQTPQPDQPVPSEEERQAQTAEVGPSGEPAEGTVTPASYPSNEEQQAQADAQDAEKESAQREHAERTGGGEVREGELQAQRDEHNARVGDASRPSDPAEQPAPESDEG